MENPITFRWLIEPEEMREYFRRRQAAYRAQAIHTVGEWPMHTDKGRFDYWQSVKREALLREVQYA